jgi:hypothetical protein
MARLLEKEVREGSVVVERDARGQVLPRSGRQTSLAAAVLSSRSRVRFCVQSREVVSEPVRGTGIASG